MSKAQSLRAGGSWLLAGEGVEKLAALARLLLLTHFMSKEEVGLAGVFILVLSFFEMLTDLGVGNLLVQAGDDDPRLLDAVHAAMAARGLLLGAVMYFAAPGLAWMFYPPGEEGLRLGGVEGLEASLRWFALVPVLRGFGHQDCNLARRRQDYRPTALMTMIPSVLMVAAAYPAAAHFRDYRAMMALILVHESAKFAVSHLVASARWRWLFDRVRGRRILAYGAPLMANGLLLYLYMLGDRTLISSAGTVFGPFFGHHGYPPASWADYMIAVQIASMPVAVLARLVSHVALPLMAKAQDDVGRFAHRYRSVLALAAVIGALMAVALALVGGVAAMVFGREYGAAGHYMGAIALMYALSLVKVVPTAALLACGDTKGALVMTLWRAAALVPIAAVAALNKDMWWMAAFGAGGEALSMVMVNLRLQRRDREFRFHQWKTLLFLVGVGAAAILADRRLAADAYAARFAWAAVLGLGALATAYLIYPAMRSQVVRAARGQLASDLEGRAPAASSGGDAGDAAARGGDAFDRALRRTLAELPDPADPADEFERVAPPAGEDAGAPEQAGPA